MLVLYSIQYIHRHMVHSRFTVNLKCLKMENTYIFNPKFLKIPQGKLVCCSSSHHQRLRPSRTAILLKKLGTAELTQLQKGKYFFRLGTLLRDAHTLELKCGRCSCFYVCLVWAVEGL